MLSLGNFPKQTQCYAFNNNNQSSHFYPIFSKIPQPHLFFSSNKVTHQSIHSKRSGVCIFAEKGEEKSNLDYDENEDEFDELDDLLVDDDDVDGDDDEEDDEVIIPLRNMKKWLENKPSGFGVDKVYDTVIEDKLMEEIEQSKKAQLVNINKLKNNPVKANSKVNQDKDVKDGFRVRLVNLPKKMNIDKDLRVAFKGVPGLVNIIPVTTGNKKTRNPICKGLAYIEFKSEDEAKRFVQMFSGRSIDFGKVQKQIKYEMMYPGSSNSTKIKTGDNIKHAPEKQISELHRELDDDSDTDLLSSDSEENTSTDQDIAEMEDLSVHTKDDLENSEISSEESTSGDEQDVREESYSADQEKEVQAKEKKKKPKQKKVKVSTLNVPGSARKLKMKEKSLLSGVLSKYAQKDTVLTVKEQSQ